jgi:hypothetical protein
VSDRIRVAIVCDYLLDYLGEVIMIAPLRTLPEPVEGRAPSTHPETVGLKIIGVAARITLPVPHLPMIRNSPRPAGPAAELAPRSG